MSQPKVCHALGTPGPLAEREETESLNRLAVPLTLLSLTLIFTFR